MVGPRVKREAVAYLQERRHLKARRACQLLGLASSTHHHQSKRLRSDEPVRARLKGLALERVRWGLPRLFELLRREGFRDNYKRVERIYRQAGLQISRRPRKKLPARVRVPLERSNLPNQFWSMDFVSDALTDNRKFRCLNIVDDCTKESLAIHVARSIRSVNVVEVLEALAGERGYPVAIRVDNGPEFIALALDIWAFTHNVKLQFIEPGKPTQNAYIESFNGKFRDECLNANWFENLEQAKKEIERWRLDYNSMRPHSSINMKTPNEFAAEFLTRHAA
jgi:putative transposase